MYSFAIFCVPYIFAKKMKEKCKKLPDMGRSADLLQLGPGVVASSPTARRACPEARRSGDGVARRGDKK
jgi:hypothetical protein